MNNAHGVFSIPRLKLHALKTLRELSHLYDIAAEFLQVR